MARLKQADDFSTKIIISLLAFVLVFVVVCLVIFVQKGYEPSALIHSVFALVAAEFWFLSRLKRAKIDKEKLENVAQCSSEGKSLSEEIIKQEGQRWNL